MGFLYWLFHGCTDRQQAAGSMLFIAIFAVAFLCGLAAAPVYAMAGSVVWLGMLYSVYRRVGE